MTETCSLCSPDDSLNARTFYESDDWFAFLDHQPLAPGHATLARRPTREGVCPVGLTREHLLGHDQAVSDVVEILNRYYARRDTRPKDFLFSSLRQKVRHIHTHLVPLWESDEQQWRSWVGYRQGHMFEFLGALERKASARSPEVKEALVATLAAQAQELRALLS